jgi:hypothetical protein
VLAGSSGQVKKPLACLLCPVPTSGKRNAHLPALFVNGDNREPFTSAFQDPILMQHNRLHRVSPMPAANLMGISFFI